MKAHALETHMTHIQRRALFRGAFSQTRKAKVVSEHAYVSPVKGQDRLRVAFAHVAVNFGSDAEARKLQGIVHENPEYQNFTTAQFVTARWTWGSGDPVGTDAMSRKEILRHVERASAKGQRYVAVIEQFSSRKGRVIFAQHVIMANDSHDIVRTVREKSLRDGMPRATLYAVVDVAAGDWAGQLKLSPSAQSQRNLSADAYAAYRAVLDERQQMYVAQAANEKGIFARVFGR